jgi:mono/diheme cytochrome c family protein
MSRMSIAAHLKQSLIAGLFLLSTLGALTLAGCAESSAAPSTPSAAVEPGLSRGKAVYQRYCNVCHPGGGRGSGPSLQTLAGIWSDQEIARLVREGKNRMPPFSDKVISNDELTDLIAYIRTLKKP